LAPAAGALECLRRMAPHSFGVRDRPVQQFVSIEVLLEEFSQRSLGHNILLRLEDTLKMEPCLGHVINEQTLLFCRGCIRAHEAIARAIELEFRRLGLRLTKRQTFRRH
jgi:hypothetical protein